jgi:cell wall-associated NlpC family hydrolase
VDFWCWEPGSERLLVRSGPAARAAQALWAERGVPGGQLLVLESVTRLLVSASRASLRGGPSHAAEQVSQLLLNAAFTQWHRDGTGAWCLGAGEDGYPGWIRAWHLAEPPANPEAAQSALIVTARHSALRADPGARGAVLLDLSFGTRLQPAGAAAGGAYPWRAPGGETGWLPAADLESGSADYPPGRTARFLAWAERLLGVPYEWGGACSWGLDCSGLIQLLAGACGIRLPRDAELQARVGAEKDPALPASWEPGHLIFFGSPRIDHVGILLPGWRLLHASGRVRIDFLDPNGALGGRPPVAVSAPLDRP